MAIQVVVAAAVEIVDLVEVLALDFPAVFFHWEVALADPNVVVEEAVAD